MVLPPSQDPDSTANAEATAFHLYTAGLVSSLLFGFVFFFLGLQKDLRWTPIAVVALGLLTILFIQRQRLIRFDHQFGAWTAYMIAIGVCFFIETQRLLVQAPQETPPEPPKIAVDIDDLVGSFAGFRKDTGGRTFVVLIIEEINRTPSRILFRYSLNENSVQRTRGDGFIYPSSETLEIQDHTIFRYKHDENGKIVLWSINRPNFRLSRISDQH